MLIQGYQAYMEMEIPKVGDDSFCLRCEDGNEHDKYVEAVMIGWQTGGNIPKKLEQHFQPLSYFPNFYVEIHF